MQYIADEDILDLKKWREVSTILAPVLGNLINA